MFCKKCGLPLSDDALFCSNCGTPTNASTNSNALEPEVNNNNADQHIYAPKTEDKTNTNNQPQQSNFNSWQQNSQQFNGYPQGPAAPKKNQQTVIITAVIAVIVIAGLIFGGIKLFSGKDSPSTIKDLVIGNWDGYQVNEKTSSSTMKFQKNGRCTIEENTDSYEGTYTIDESNKSNVIIELELSDPEGDTQTLSLTLKKINDDKFQLIRDDDPDAEDPLTLIRHK